MNQTEWMNDEYNASLRADPEASFQGTATISVETGPDLPLDFAWLVSDDLGSFLRLIRKLPAREQEVMLCYYVLGQNQQQIAKATKIGFGQSPISLILRRAQSRLLGTAPRGVRQPTPRVLKRVDPPHLGEFRVPMKYTSDMLSPRSEVRSGSDVDYGAILGE